MMTADELRELADGVTRADLWATKQAAEYLRACADALEKGPVAWADGCGSAVTRGELKGREPHEFTADPDVQAYRIPLYPVAMPAPTAASRGGDMEQALVEQMIEGGIPVPMTASQVADMLDAAPTPPVQQDDEALEVLRRLVAAIDEFTVVCAPQAIRSAGQRVRTAEAAARALIAKRGEK